MFLTIINNSNDALEKSLILGDLTISFKESISILLISLLAGILVRGLYIRFANSFSSKLAYGNTLLMVTICVASLIAVVKSSLALSLGLVGALSVVRFRTAVKEPYTLSFILLSVCLGIAIGANQYRFALSIGTIGTLSALFINKDNFKKNKSKNNSNDIDTLSIESENYEAIIQAISDNSYLKTYSISTFSSNVDSYCNATIKIHIENNQDLNLIIKQLTEHPGIKNVTFYNSPV